MPLLRCFKQNAVKFWNPTHQFLVECLKAFRILVTQAIQHARKRSSVPGQFHRRLQKHWLSNRFGIKRKYSCTLQSHSWLKRLYRLAPVDLSEARSIVIRIPDRLNLKFVFLPVPPCSKRNRINLWYAGGANVMPIKITCMTKSRNST